VRANTRKSPVPLARLLQATGAPEDRIVWVGRYEAGVAFYGGFTEMPEVEGTVLLEQYADSWLVVRRKEVREAPEVFEGVQSAGTFRIGRETYHVYPPGLTDDAASPYG
jgi:hypothetical protein